MAKKNSVTQTFDSIKVCSRCGSSNISYNLALEEEQRSNAEGCFLGYFITIFLIFIPIIGWILLYMMFNEKRKLKNVTYAICNNCGNSWKVSSENEKQKSNKGFVIVLIIILIIALVAYYYAVFKGWI